MNEVEVKVDSKGRIRLPAELREEVGEVAVLMRTPEGLLIKTGKRGDFLEGFKQVMTSEPMRTGVPENWVPKRMKAIWGSGH